MDNRSFLAWEQATRDTIDLKKIYIDVAGDLVTGVLLSQIVYWNLPSKDGQTKLRVKHKNELWLAKGRSDWWEECRISPKQFDRSIKILEEKDIVDTALKKFNGSPTKHIKLNMDILLKKINKILEIEEEESKSETSQIDDKDLKIAELEKKIKELEGQLENKKEEPDQELKDQNKEGEEDPPEEDHEELSLDDDFKEVVTFYQQNIGIMPPIMIELFSDYSDKLGKDLVMEAIREAVLNQVRKPRYIEKILMSWEENGINSLDKLNAVRLERELEKNKGGKEGGSGHGSQGHVNTSGNTGNTATSPGDDEEETLYDKFRKQRAEQDDT